MKIMAADYGDARTGLAVCDRTETLASPVGLIEEKSMAKVAEKLVYATREYEAGMLVLGLPVNMDGSEGPRAKKTRKLGSILEKIIDIPLEYWDERVTSKGADALLSEAGVFGRRRKKEQDALAAALILEGFLVRRRAAPAPKTRGGNIPENAPAEKSRGEKEEK